jgi:hypothetical protein
MPRSRRGGERIKAADEIRPGAPVHDDHVERSTTDCGYQGRHRVSPAQRLPSMGDPGFSGMVAVRATARNSPRCTPRSRPSPAFGRLLAPCGSSQPVRPAPLRPKRLDCGIDRGDATAESGGSEPSAGPAFANAILHHVRLRLQQIRQGTLVLLSSADATRYDVGRLPRQPSGGQPSGGQSVEGLRGVGR